LRPRTASSSTAAACWRAASARRRIWPHSPQLPKLEWGTEHFGPRILVEDLVIAPLRFDEFEICVPDGPDLGVQIDEDKVRGFARKD
jgi:L-alanine-DL-glutamate epimerase-like enolase superfamily enzyme